MFLVTQSPCFPLSSSHLLFLPSTPFNFHAPSVYLSPLPIHLSRHLQHLRQFVSPFRIHSSNPFLCRLLSSSWPLSPSRSMSIQRSLCLCFSHLLCSLTSTLLTPTIHLSLCSPVISATHFYYCSAVECWFPSLSHTSFFFLVFRSEIPSILCAAFVGWFYYMSPNCWIIQ